MPGVTAGSGAAPHGRPQPGPARHGLHRLGRRAGGVSTGISAADRAHTLRLLADPSTTAADLARPGHVFPLRARDGECCSEPDTEAAVDLCRLAGLAPVGVIAGWCTTTAR